MAKKDQKSAPSLSSISSSVKALVDNLNTTAQSTNSAVYQMDRDLYGTSELVEKLMNVSNKDKETLKRTVDGNSYANSRINSFGLNSVPNKSKDKVFDVIQGNQEIFNDLYQLLMVDNKLYEAIADYEILRRSIPQISRVIDLLINSILIPEVITTDTYNLKFEFDEARQVDVKDRLNTKYELAKKIRVIVENYLVIGAEYVTVVPYKAVVDAIKADASPSARASMLRESTLGIPSGKKSSIITESVILDSMTEKLRQTFNSNKEAERKTGLKALNESMEEYINGIRIYRTNKKLSYDEALVESITSDRDSFMVESSFEEFFSDNAKIKLKSGPGITSKTPTATSDSADGLIQADAKGYDKIRVNGCKIERLDPARVYPIRLKDTVIAYVYLEQRRDEALRYNLQNSMRNSFSFYRMDNATYTEHNVKMLEDRMIREIGNRVLSNLSPKFLEANFDDMDIFYEFLRDNNIHTDRRDIILLHPKDVIEFKRPNGSILKNAVFFAKMYLLMIVNNILTKVRRGSDRTVFYVSNGLSNDIEGAVMQAIEAIQSSEIGFDALSTMTGVINSVGSVVDLFLPQTDDGMKPISPEVISGQEVNMDDDFLQFLIKSIILSFNLPSVVVDYTNEVEFARTLSMANLDVATSSALAQGEINGPLTELVKRVLTYEYDLTEEEANTIEANLIPSKSMLIQLTGDLIETTKALAQSIADTQITGNNQDVLKPLFIKEFIRRNFNYDWDEIDEILEKILEEALEQTLKQGVSDSVDNASPELAGMSTDGSSTDTSGGDAGAGDDSGMEGY